MPIHGRGFRYDSGEFGVTDVDDYIGRLDVLDQQKAMAAVVADYFWDTTPTPMTIPYAWLAKPVRFRADQPINDPVITVSGNGDARSPNSISITTYGDFGASPTLLTAVGADADNLASWMSTNYSDFRMRCPSLTVNMLHPQLGPLDLQSLLAVKIGDRITITGAPATWPAGTSSLFVEGIGHNLAHSIRQITFNTSPVVGSSPGIPGPYFRWGTSTWSSSTDLIPF